MNCTRLLYRSKLLNISNDFIRFKCNSSTPYPFKARQIQGKTCTLKNNVIICRHKSIRVQSLAAKNDSQIGVFGYLLLGIPVVTFILGTWQIQRRKWKLDLIDTLKSRTQMAPRELPENLQELETMEYCPVKVRGKFLHDKEFTIGPRSLIVDGTGLGEGQGNIFSSGQNLQGYHVITPFQLEDRDLTILVNRGWVPKKYRNPSERQRGQIEDTVEITGLVRLNEKRPQFLPKNSPEQGVWYYRDLNAMAEMTGASPIFIDLLAKDRIPGAPVGGQTRVTLRNEHLSYIITWYALSAITGYMWYRQHILKLPLA